MIRPVNGDGGAVRGSGLSVVESFGVSAGGSRRGVAGGVVRHAGTMRARRVRVAASRTARGSIRWTASLSAVRTAAGPNDTGTRCTRGLGAGHFELAASRTQQGSGVVGEPAAGNCRMRRRPRAALARCGGRPRLRPRHTLSTRRRAASRRPQPLPVHLAASSHAASSHIAAARSAPRPAHRAHLRPLLAAGAAGRALVRQP